jgi:hypothetical protein
MLLSTVSYFGFRSNVARRRGENSCSTVQNWCRLSEITPNLHQLRQTGSAQVFAAWAERARWGASNSKTRGKCTAKGMPLRGIDFMSELKLRPTKKEVVPSPAAGTRKIHSVRRGRVEGWGARVYFFGASERMRSISRRPLAPQPVASSGIAGRNFT